MKRTYLALLVACHSSAGTTQTASIQMCSNASECAAPPACAEAVCEQGICKAYARDADGDGHRASRCSGPQVVLGDDCDDSLATAYPGAWDGPAHADGPDRCNQIDEDCSGIPDDRQDSAGAVCACSEGAPCAAPGWTVAQGNVGECKIGVTQCGTGTGVTCSGAQGPIEANCATDRDFDCNGMADSESVIACETENGCQGVRCPGADSCIAPSQIVAFEDSDLDQYCVHQQLVCVEALNDPTLKLRRSEDCILSAPAPPPCNPSTAACEQARAEMAANLVVQDCDDTDKLDTAPVLHFADRDGDAACVSSTAQMACKKAGPANYRLATSCTQTSDCDDNPGAHTRANDYAVRVDSDSDGYCTAAGSVARCCGLEQSGTRCRDGTGYLWRMESSCNTNVNDCDDGNSAIYQARQLRSDADHDNWCAGAAVTTCIGASPPAGTKVDCSNNDCKDTNEYATSTCSEVRASGTVTCTQGGHNKVTIYPGLAPAGFTMSCSITANGSEPGYPCHVMLYANGEADVRQHCSGNNGRQCTGECKIIAN